VIPLHDIHRTTVEAMPGILDNLAVTVSRPFASQRLTTDRTWSRYADAHRP
jgi:hypothetical protein